MRVREFRFCAYDIPLRSPIRTAHGTIAERRGFIVAALSPEGLAGVGEVAPLPEFGTEDYDCAREALAGIEHEVRDLDLKPDYRDFASSFPSDSYFDFSYSACRFGIDCALAGLARLTARAWSARPHRVFDHRSPFQINALIGGESPKGILESAAQAMASGYGTLKLKIGVLSADEEVRAIRSLRAVNPGMRLRLDANCAMTASAAVDFCERIQDCNIEYIEDPAYRHDLTGLREFHSHSRIKTAVDALLAPVELIYGDISWEDFDVLVLKPSLVGTMADLERIEQRAIGNGKRIVYTSMFESSLGIACILGFMRPGASPDLAHGLGTAHFLSEDTLTPRMLPENGLLKVVDVRALAWMLKDPYKSRLGIAR